MPASESNLAWATERTTRNLTPSLSSSTSNREPAPSPNRRRAAAGRMIWPFDETTIVDTVPW
jgi:hypothetical protein